MMSVGVAGNFRFPALRFPSEARALGPTRRQQQRAAPLQTRQTRPTHVNRPQPVCPSKPAVASGVCSAIAAMDPPDMDALSLSDSDSDALFDTPAARKAKSKARDAAADTADGAATGKTRGKESHYSTEEAREAALRKELETVRNVNKVIEGVVESLQKAKDNMNV